MNRNEYLNNLEIALKAYNIENWETIVEKYRKRFDLAAMADMTEEEAIKMMGSVDSVCRKYMNEADNTSYQEIYSLKIDDSLAEDIIIRKSEKSGIVVNIDEELADKLNINKVDKKITISDKFGKSLFRKARGKIFIEIGPNIKFDLFEVKTVSCDVEICDIDSKKFVTSNVSGDYKIDKIFAEEARLTTVSGDYMVNRIKANEFRLSTVSGDAVLGFVEIDNAIFDTISGDISVTGRVNRKRGSSISGSINYKEIN